jgi:hypothetical protein
MNYKYAPQSKRIKGQCKGWGNAVNPNRWNTGPNPVTHDKYYAWLKHRAQCKFRNEDYNLSWEDWQTLWCDDKFLQRGRTRDSLCLYKLEIDGVWDISNVQVGTRMEYLARGKEYRNARS